MAVGLAVFILCGLFGSVLWALSRLLTGQDIPRVFEHAGQESARRLNGSYVHGGLRERRVSFDIRGRAAEIRFYPEDGPRPARTGVLVRLSSPSPGTLHLCHTSLARALGAEYGFDDIHIGHPELDARFMIRATPRAFAKRLFSLERLPRLSAALLDLVRLATPEVELTRERLAVRVPVLLDDAARLVELARGAAALLEDVEDTIAGADIHLSPLEAREGECQVCLGPLKEDVVLCRLCRTPHHGRCWSWTGECSTYACRERRFLRGS